MGEEETLRRWLLRQGSASNRHVAGILNGGFATGLPNGVVTASAIATGINQHAQAATA